MRNGFAARSMGMRRSRPFDATRLFNRALTYSVLITLIGASYVFGVVQIDALFGLSSDWLAPPQLVASGLVALVLAPVRCWIETRADRLVYGRRMPVYDVLASISALSQATGPAGQALHTLARITAEGLAIPTATVHLQLCDGSRTSYHWPKHAAPPCVAEADHTERRVPITYNSITVGAISLPTQTRRDLAPDRRRLLEDLARSVGVILHNASLTVQLEDRLRVFEAQSAQIRVSRWRIVAAQDQERRDLERDLHDDAQPGLTAVRLALGLLDHLVTSGNRDAAQRAFNHASEQITSALDGLRRTLHDLYPQALTEHGLGPALRERVDALGCPARIDLDTQLTQLRFDPAVEAVIYYCCAEALQNTAKHAPGAPVTVALTLDAAHERLRFTVTDNGPGFDAESTRGGAGLQNMADRIGTLGGTLELRSVPGIGTQVAAWVPASVFHGDLE